MTTGLRRAFPALLAAAVLVLSACGQSVDVSKLNRSIGSDSAAVLQARSQKALDAFAASLTSGDLSGAGSDSAKAAISNSRALGVRDISLRYIDGAALDASDRDRFGPTATAARVQVGYTIPTDPGPTSMEMGAVFASVAGTTKVVSFGGHGARSALWIDGSAAVQINGRVTVVDARPETAPRFMALGQQAITAVGQVLPSWTGQLFLEVPTDKDQLASIIQSSASTGGDIAAVTTSADGTLNPTSPLHVYLNRDVFATMSDVGSQIVVSHEATHVATKGPLTSVPTWMLEGFADFVALDHAGVPVSKAARQELARMQKDGLPDHLPTTADLSPSAEDLGATYEEAWLAWRYLGATYGEAKAVAFYMSVAQGTSVDAAFTKVLGVSQAAFVQGWRSDLEQLLKASAA